MASLGSRLVSLLGREWRRFNLPSEEHVTTVYWGDGLWHWRCEACPSLGYGNVPDKIEAAARRHAGTAISEITKR